MAKNQAHHAAKSGLCVRGDLEAVREAKSKKGEMDAKRREKGDDARADTTQPETKNTLRRTETDGGGNKTSGIPAGPGKRYRHENRQSKPPVSVNIWLGPIAPGSNVFVYPCYGHDFFHSPEQKQVIDGYDHEICGCGYVKGEARREASGGSDQNGTAILNDRRQR